MPSLHLVKGAIGHALLIMKTDVMCLSWPISATWARGVLWPISCSWPICPTSAPRGAGAQLEMLSTCNTGGYSALYRACVLGRTMIYRATGWPCPPEEDTRWWWSTNNKEKLHLYGENTHKYGKIYLHDMTTSVFIDLCQVGVSLLCRHVCSCDLAELIY